MKLFTPSTNTQAYGKVGIMGFAGSGKTYTATLIAIGLVKMMRELRMDAAKRPVMFLDTETGADWIQPMLRDQRIELLTAKTRAFRDLVPAVKEAEKEGSVLIIDSITHFWKELTDSYQRKLNRKRLQFQDWNVIKPMWQTFTDALINSNVHILMCGRAGWEYDYFEQEGGSKELEKTGIRMKAETETAFEPSLLLLMERHHDINTNEVYREAHVLKDRSTVIDGKTFRNPAFIDFKPHFDYLHWGGEQLGVDTERKSDEMFDKEGKPDWQREKEAKEICLDEIKEVIQKHHGGSSKDEKAARGDILEKHFGTRAWTRVESLALKVLQHGRDELWQALEGVPYSFQPPQEEKASD